MALTELQRGICRLIAANRIAGGESYVSRDIDLFHDTEEALDRTWRADRDLLQADGYEVVVVRERPSHVQAVPCCPPAPQVRATMAPEHGEVEPDPAGH